jgi:hypothetical protein
MLFTRSTCSATLACAAVNALPASLPQVRADLTEARNLQEESGLLGQAFARMIVHDFDHGLVHQLAANDVHTGVHHFHSGA